MARPLNFVATPIRFMLLLALLLVIALLVGFSVNQPPIQRAGSHSLPASGLITAPNAGSQPAAGTVANQGTTPSITRIVSGSTQGPAGSAPPAAAEPAQAAPTGATGCQVNPPAGRDMPVTCLNP
jgi:hypothetical protein